VALGWLLCGSWTAMPAWGQQPPPLDPTVQGVELRMRKFDKPLRVGYGKEARFYSEALEIRLTVTPYLERGIEPFLYIGDIELRGHETVRRSDGLTLVFYAFEPEKLREGACIILTTDHGAPLRKPALQRDCPFRFSWRNILWLPSSSPAPSEFADLKVRLHDPRGRPVQALELGDSLSIGLTGLPRGAPIQIYVLDDQNREWSYARLFADRNGAIEPTLLWYNTGVIGTTTRKVNWKPDPSFETFEQARAHFAAHPVRLEFRNLKGDLIRAVPLPLATARRTPLLYPSSSRGVPMNTIEARRDDVFVTGTNFPPGAKVLLFLVKNQYMWNAGDRLADVTGPDLMPAIETVELAPNETAFTRKVWDHRLARPGSYDLVARIVKRLPEDLQNQRFRLQDTDILSYAEDTGVILYTVIGSNIVVDTAGRLRGSPAYFEFADSFERHEPVFGAVDPTDVPAMHSGGNYAAYYVVEHQPASYWDGPNPALVDVSGGVEIKRVKYWCINVSREKIWADPDPSVPIKEYDVVVSFGAVPALTAADFVQDNIYHKGTDFLDGYNKVGFYVLDDPATPGPFAVGSRDHYDDTFNMPADPNDPFNFSALGFPLVRNWFTIRYPAGGMGGPGAPLPAGAAKYPVALFLHGRHWICSVGVSGYSPEHYSTTCATGTKIPSHRGYNYILDVLASHGIIAISVDAFDIQPSQGLYNYEARGRLILEHLNRLKAWNLNGTDPFGGIFQNRIDMTKIGIVGHSRGGEGVVAAAEINVTEAATYGHSIVVVVAIAPTDQQSGTKWDIETAPYLLLAGAADGDVSNQQGFRTYDRAYPAGAPTQHPKAVVWIHGANHNYFNTVWTPSPPLPTPNPYDGAEDDGSFWTGPKITDVEQRRIALSTIVGFMRQQLQGIQPYREVFTGRLQLAALRKDMMHWSYQDAVRLRVDDFQQGMPGAIATNSLNGPVTLSPGFTQSAETSFGAGGAPSDPCFYHQTWGVKLGWNSAQTYASELPAGQQDVKAYTHLSFRVTQIPDALLSPVGSPKNLQVNLQDTDGDSAAWDLDTDDFTPIPYPYQRAVGNVQCQMKTVRIPLRSFTKNNSAVELDKIQKVVIKFPGTGLVGIDDIHFSK
jgi:hypothetical protein